MFIDFDTHAPAPRGSWTALPDDEALLLWSLRRLVVAWPGSPAVEAALLRRWGGDATGVLQLLRCWLAALGHRARGSLTVGDPACARLLPDEAAMLRALRHPAGAGVALAGRCRDADALVPLAAALNLFMRPRGAAPAAASRR